MGKKNKAADVTQQKKSDLGKRIEKYGVFYILTVIPVAYLLVFRFWPVLLQLVLSFKEYSIKGGYLTANM